MSTLAGVVFDPLRDKTYQSTRLGRDVAGNEGDERIRTAVTAQWSDPRCFCPGGVS